MLEKVEFGVLRHAGPLGPAVGLVGLLMLLSLSKRGSSITNEEPSFMPGRSRPTFIADLDWQKMIRGRLRPDWKSYYDAAALAFEELAPFSAPQTFPFRLDEPMIIGVLRPEHADPREAFFLSLEIDYPSPDRQTPKLDLAYFAALLDFLHQIQQQPWLAKSIYVLFAPKFNKLHQPYKFTPAERAFLNWYLDGDEISPPVINDTKSGVVKELRREGIARMALAVKSPDFSQSSTSLVIKYEGPENTAANGDMLGSFLSHLHSISVRMELRGVWASIYAQMNGHVFHERQAPFIQRQIPALEIQLKGTDTAKLFTILEDLIREQNIVNVRFHHSQLMFYMTDWRTWVKSADWLVPQLVLIASIICGDLRNFVNEEGQDSAVDAAEPEQKGSPQDGLTEGTQREIREVDSPGTRDVAEDTKQDAAQGPGETVATENGAGDGGPGETVATENGAGDGGPGETVATENGAGSGSAGDAIMRIDMLKFEPITLEVQSALMSLFRGTFLCFFCGLIGVWGGWMALAGELKDGRTDAHCTLEPAPYVKAALRSCLAAGAFAFAAVLCLCVFAQSRASLFKDLSLGCRLCALLVVWPISGRNVGLGIHFTLLVALMGWLTQIISPLRQFHCPKPILIGALSLGVCLVSLPELIDLLLGHSSITSVFPALLSLRKLVPLKPLAPLQGVLDDLIKADGVREFKETFGGKPVEPVLGFVLQSWICQLSLTFPCLLIATSYFFVAATTVCFGLAGRLVGLDKN